MDMNSLIQMLMQQQGHGGMGLAQGGSLGPGSSSGLGHPGGGYDQPSGDLLGPGSSSGLGRPGMGLDGGPTGGNPGFRGNPGGFGMGPMSGAGGASMGPMGGGGMGLRDPNDPGSSQSPGASGGRWGAPSNPWQGGGMTSAMSGRGPMPSNYFNDAGGGYGQPAPENGPRPPWGITPPPQPSPEGPGGRFGGGPRRYPMLGGRGPGGFTLMDMMQAGGRGFRRGPGGVGNSGY
jgi:hypothetical protein